MAPPCGTAALSPLRSDRAPFRVSALPGDGRHGGAALTRAHRSIRPADCSPSNLRRSGQGTQAHNGTFTGTITTATLKLKATLRPIDIEGDKAPNYRLLVGTVECGAGWKKTSRQERDYISVKFDDPTFPAPIYASLVETDTAGEYALIWSR